MLLKPLKDQNGINTPSWASRIWFIITVIGSATYVFFQISNDIVIWSTCTLFLSTILLNIGWILFAKLSAGMNSGVLFDSISDERKE
tara:strand:- start:952 stop:1212 length:261 start_codon:yes stop_codon:yes gene_type:complete